MVGVFGVGRFVRSMPVSKHRKRRKFRSTGRHAAPSHIGMAAQKAGKAVVPAAAMIGALAVAPQAHASPTPSRSAAVPSHLVYPTLDALVLPAGLANAASLAEAARPDRPVHAARPGDNIAATQTYTVQPGDTLSGIAFRFYGSARAWQWLYQVNSAEIANPNLISPGWVLHVPQDVPATSRGIGADNAATGNAQRPQGSTDGWSASSQPQLPSAPHGTLGCSGLEALWRAAGGASSVQVTAASIAMAESSGNQYATGPYGERGYWQIHPDHGALSTYDAFGNARAAVIISDDGTNWSPWTTFVDGAYLGKC